MSRAATKQGFEAHPTLYSKLLIDDHPLQVLPALAVVVGLNEAIVLQQLHYWLRRARFVKIFLATASLQMKAVRNEVGAIIC